MHIFIIHDSEKQHDNAMCLLCLSVTLEPVALSVHLDTHFLSLLAAGHQRQSVLLLLPVQVNSVALNYARAVYKQVYKVRLLSFPTASMCA